MLGRRMKKLWDTRNALKSSATIFSKPFPRNSATEASVAATRHLNGVSMCKLSWHVHELLVLTVCPRHCIPLAYGGL
jgi:hypothetical protein